MGGIMRRHWLPVCMSEEVAEPDGAPVRARLLGEDLVVFRDSQRPARRAGRALPAPRRLAGLRPQRGVRPALPLPRLEVRRGRQHPRHGRRKPPGAAHASRHEAQGLSGTRRRRLRLGVDGPEETADARSSSRRPGRRCPASSTRSSRCTPRATGRRCWRARSIRRTARACTRPTCRRPRSSRLHRHRERLAAPFERQGAAPAVRADRLTASATRRSASRSANAETHEYVRTTLFIAPFTVLIPPNNQYNLAQMLVPIDDVNTMFYWIAWHPDRRRASRSRRGGASAPPKSGVDLDRDYRKKRNLANDYLQDRAAMKRGDFTGIEGIPTQDMAMWETMGPIADRSARPPRRERLAVVQFRRMMVAAVKKFQDSGQRDRRGQSAHRARRARLVRGHGAEDGGLAHARRAPPVGRDGLKPDASGDQVARVDHAAARVDAARRQQADAEHRLNVLPSAASRRTDRATGLQPAVSARARSARTGAVFSSRAAISAAAQGARPFSLPRFGARRKASTTGPFSSPTSNPH